MKRSSIRPFVAPDEAACNLINSPEVLSPTELEFLLPVFFSSVKCLK